MRCDYQDEWTETGLNEHGGHVWYHRHKRCKAAATQTFTMTPGYWPLACGPMTRQYCDDHARICATQPAWTRKER